jgi:hypothetical protein
VRASNALISHKKLKKAQYDKRITHHAGILPEQLK